MKNKILPELILIVLIVLQTVILVFGKSFIPPEAGVVKKLEKEDYKSAAQLMNEKDIKNSEKIKSWVASELPQKLDKYSDTAGSEKGEQLLEFVDLLIQKGYSPERELRNCLAIQNERHNYLSGDISAVSVGLRIAEIDRSFDMQSIYTSLENFETEYLLSIINQKRAENSCELFPKDTALNDLCKDFAGKGSTSEYSDDDIMAKTKALGIDVSELSFYAAGAGKCITADDFIEMLSDDARNKLYTSDDLKRFGAGVVYDKATNSIMIFAEAAALK